MEKKPPSKEVLNEFKDILKIKIEYFEREEFELKDKNIIEIIIDCTFTNSYVDRHYNIKLEDCFDLIELLAYYEVEVDKYIYIIDEYKKPLETCKTIMKRMAAGKKIANFIEKAMDDEFELKPLRTKIDMRKILEADKNL
jgi:hypothetical protein